MSTLLDLLLFKSALSWILIATALATMMLMSRAFGLNIANGLINAQITLFFNVLVVVGGMDAGLVADDRVLHFFLVEFGFLAAIMMVYRSMLKHRAQVLAALKQFFEGRGAYLLTGFVGMLAAFNFVFAPDDGSSRIGYMTEAWFSIFKPFIQITTPLSYMGTFLLLQIPRRKVLGYVLFLISIVANVATGSKASFMLALLFAYLGVRDLTGNQLQLLSARQRSILIAFGALITVAVLANLAVSPQDVIDRFLLYGEANIMTYFSPDPTAACSDVSLFARMHRGWARLLGDPSALDIDTLFGFALMLQEVGVNTLTGPNARLSAYFLCNFPAQQFIFGLIVVAAYLGLVRLSFAQTRKRPLVCAIFYPFLLASLHGASQDFNLIMQDITILSGLCVLLTAFPTVRRLQPSHV
ncbi:hypothetical protein [Pelomonas sp. KK5]|uniref:hypothetical protein n=1 Tax=Pelomonas sp. KK5 TaxID=1855730 RepID=UPI00097BBA4F|nr:hypothetical protein [Pelomonas sp. KK5]